MTSKSIPLQIQSVCRHCTHDNFMYYYYYFWTLNIDDPERFKKLMLCKEAAMAISAPPGQSCHSLIKSRDSIATGSTQYI